MMKRILVMLLIAATPAIASGQGSSSARTRALAEAVRLGNSGQTAAARAMIDSLIKGTPADASDLADLLFARATFAVSVLDAGLDYQRIISDLPSSTPRRESLLRVAQRALIAGESAKALDYLATRAREYTDDSSTAITNYWKARVLFDAHDLPGACGALRDAARAGRNAGTEFSDIEALATSSCTGGQAISVMPADTPVTRAPVPAPKPKIASAASSRIFAVQVSAYDRQKDAEAMAERLRKKGLDAHVDGTARPFRVRIGRFETQAEAAKQLRELKARGISGFIAEVTP